MRKTHFLSVLPLVATYIGTTLAAGSAWEVGNTRCIPNFRHEKPVGYICVEVDLKSEYRAIGLKKGDTVVEINSQPVFDPSFSGDPTERALGLWRDFDKTEVGTLLVERGDSKVLLKKSANRK